MLKLDKKQKITAGITVVVFLFLIWQVYGLLRGDVSTAEAAPVIAPKTVIQTPTTASTPAPTTTPAAEPLKNETPSTPKTAPNNNAANTADSLSAETIGQHREYLQMSDQLQLARMQAQLLSQQLAVVQAKKQIADLSQQTNQVLASTNNTNGSDNLMDLDQNKLRLAYIAKVNGEWTATVFKDGDYQSVQVGSLLPNGALVVRINKKGVLFRDGDEFKLMSFDSILSVRDPTGNTIDKNSTDLSLVSVATEIPNNAMPAPTPSNASAPQSTTSASPKKMNASNNMNQKKLALDKKSIDVLKAQ